MTVDESISESRLEQALVAAAYVVAKHGSKYAPILNRIERELAAFQRMGDPRLKAQRILERYQPQTIAGGLKAIR